MVSARKPAPSLRAAKKAAAKKPARAAKKKRRNTPLKVLVLRTCDKDLRSYGGYKWPKRGVAKARDWKADDQCGHGLHGLLWGVGAGELLDWDHADAKWLVVEVRADQMMKLGGKVKFPRGRVVYCGNQLGATDYLRKHGAAKEAVVGATVTAPAGGNALVGYRGWACAGPDGIATAGHYGTAAVGRRGIATAGPYGTATAGDNGTARAGHEGTATAGSLGNATAGDGGNASAGSHGRAKAGNNGVARAGVYGTAVAGDDGTAIVAGQGSAAAGHRGSLIFDYYDKTVGKQRRLVAAVGRDGIEPNALYHIDQDGKLARKLDAPKVS